MIRIASWNVNSLKVRLPQVLEWCQQTQPDILALQETKLTDAQFPADALREAGYHVVFSGQKTYNGVAVMSKHPCEDVVTDIPGLDDPQRRILATTIGSLRVLNLYVPNGQAVGSEKFDYKLNWLRAVDRYCETQLKDYPLFVALGDFNIAPADEDVYDPEAWHGSVLCSEPEREAFRQLLGLGLVDTFRLFAQNEKSYSWWDYREMAFRRNRGLRIDHILASTELAGKCSSSTIDREPRKRERPSDHAPVCASFDMRLTP